MHITFVHGWNMWGGGEKHTLALARSLAGRGHEVSIAQLGHDRFRRFWTFGRCVTMERDPGLLKWIAQLRTIAPDAICEVRGGGLRFGGALDVATSLLRICSLPIEHSPYGDKPKILAFGRRHAPRQVVRLVAHKIRRLIHARATGTTFSVAEHVAASVRRHLDIDIVQAVPNGVDTDRFRFRDQLRAEFRGSCNISQDALVIGTLGRLSSEKEVTLLLKAFALASENLHLPAALVIAGTGPELERLKNEAGRLHLQDCTYFIGFREDAEAVLCGIDIYVSSSRSEGLSLALLEALSSERLCVCLPYPGLDEISNCNPAVSVAGSRAVPDLVSSILAASRLEPCARAALGADGRALVIEKFDECRQIAALTTEIEDKVKLWHTVH
jgi:glycosyltransferase involved in cell wall biosynthesis